MNKKLTCEVCNKNEAVGVASGACGPVSSAYCQDCLKKGAEPYGYLVGYISMAGTSREEIHESYYSIIKATCEVTGRTEEQFWKDCKRFVEDYDRYCEEHDQYVEDQL